jgi:hypothetical protein
MLLIKSLTYSFAVSLASARAAYFFMADKTAAHFRKSFPFQPAELTTE